MNTKVFVSVRVFFLGVVFFPYCLQFSGSFAITWGLLSVFFSRLDMTSWFPSVFSIPLAAHGLLSSVWRRCLKLSGRSKKYVLSLSNKQLSTDNNAYSFLFNVDFRLYVLFSALLMWISIWTSQGTSFLGLTVFQVCSMLTLFKSPGTGLFNLILPCSNMNSSRQMFKSVAWNI